ncbi:MAG: CADD family putative folate metabolism protein [Vicinamibacterales bacterium]
MSEIVTRIHAQIATRRLLDHPFYNAWSKGELSREALQTYAAQYYHWVLAFPTWLSATHANAGDLAMRQDILANLIDEEQGADNHPELWLRFCDAVGLDRDAVKNVELLPETAQAIAAMRRVSREMPAAASLAALYAYESQQPEVMKTKREGLRDLYKVTEGHGYFEVHETLDVEHSAGEAAMIARHGDGCAAEIDAAVTTALDATYTLLDGVERVRVH